MSNCMKTNGHGVASFSPPLLLLTCASLNAKIGEALVLGDVAAQLNCHAT